VLHVEGGAHLYGGALQVLYLLEGLAGHSIENHLACRPGIPLAQRSSTFAQVHALPMGGDLDLGLLLRLYRLIRKTRPDLVHLHSRIGADVMGGLAARFAGLPVVHTRRVDNPEPRVWVGLKYRLHDRVIAISEGIAAVLRREGVPASKLRLVRSAIIAERYQHPCDAQRVRSRLGLPADAGPLIGVVAQLIPRKGHAVLLEALPGLLKVWPGLQVLCFGQGPSAARLEQRIAELGLKQHVHLCGFRDDLPDILPCLTVLAHPALMEGLGVSLLQAASAQVPIVASRVGGIPEVVVDGHTGFLVPAGDTSALAEALRRMLADSALRQRFGRAGRERVARDFSASAMVAGNLKVYRELIEAHPA
jgi:glycosyltransferase involved in cell wall biosynthesis